MGVCTWERSYRANVLAILSLCVCQSPRASVTKISNSDLMTTNYQAPRRLALSTYLGADGIAIIPTAPERQRNRDSDFLYRHDSYFYYLTGFAEPNAWLVLTGDGRAHPVLRTQGPGARDLGRLPARPGGGAGRAGGGRGLLGRRARHPAAPAAGEPVDRLVPVRHAQGAGVARRRLAVSGARAGALRRAVPRGAARPVRPARRDAAGEGRARAGRDAPRRADQRARPRPRHAAVGAHAARRQGRARVPPRRRAAARVPPGRLAVPGLRLDRRGRRQRLRAALPRRRGAGARRRPGADRRGLRARRLRQRHHAHLPGQRQVHRAAARAVRPGAGEPGRGRGRHPGRRSASTIRTRPR